MPILITRYPRDTNPLILVSTWRSSNQEERVGISWRSSNQEERVGISWRSSNQEERDGISWRSSNQEETMVSHGDLVIKRRGLVSSW